MAQGQRLQGADLALHAFGAFAVALVDHEDVGDLHDAGLDGLHIVAHAGDENHNGDVGEAHDVDFILTDADGLDQDDVAAGGVEHGGDVGGGARQAAQRSARRHAANVNSGVGEMFLHADAVAQNRSAGVGTGWVDGDDSHGVVLLAIEPRQLVDQRALPRSRRAGQPDDASAPAVREQCFQQIGPSGRRFSTVEMARARVRTSPERSESIHDWMS